MTLSFDAIANQFDDQRGLPVDALHQLVAFFERISPGSHLQIVEPGIGTGRIALPLAAAGHSVTGVDVSNQMLDACARKADALSLSDRVTLHPGFATDLPSEDDAFDAGIFASLLYLVSDWESVLDELARTVRPGGAVIQLRERTEPGAALARWDAAWRQRIEATGFTHETLSPTDHDVLAAMKRRWPDVTTEPLATWGFGQTIGDAMDSYSHRLRALYPTVEDAAWDATVDDFLSWARASFPDPGTSLDGQVVLEAVTGWA